MSSSPDPVQLGRELATRHGNDSSDVDDGLTLLQVAESPRTEDWTLRSALVRFAQPQPELSGAILESVRRSQAAIDPLARKLLVHGRVTDRQLSIASGGGLTPPVDPCPDARIADLARLARAGVDGDVLFDAYDAALEAAGSPPLDQSEREVVPLLMVLLDLDELAEMLAAWAATTAPADPPVAEAKRLGRAAFDRLGALGVAREGRSRGA